MPKVYLPWSDGQLLAQAIREGDNLHRPADAAGSLTCGRWREVLLDGDRLCAGVGGKSVFATARPVVVDRNKAATTPTERGPERCARLDKVLAPTETVRPTEQDPGALFRKETV